MPAPKPVFSDVTPASGPAGSGSAPVSENTPNAETLKTFRETDKGENLTRWRSLDEMMRALTGRK